MVGKGGGRLGKKMLKCLLTDSGVLLFIMNTIKNRFPEVPAAMCAMITIFMPYVNIHRRMLFIFFYLGQKLNRNTFYLFSLG